jgi:hypothetical protein
VHIPLGIGNTDTLGIEALLDRLVQIVLGREEGLPFRPEAREKID